MKSKTPREKNIETIKANVSLEGFAREDVLRYAEDNHLNAGDVLTLILDSLKERCPYNFFGCSDTEGYHLAWPLDEISEALNIPHPTCQEVCEHGCCAYINKILASVGGAVHKADDDEA